MNMQNIKTKLIGALGEKPVACIQALRFAYLLYAKTLPDHEVALLPSLLKKGDTAIDIGANGASWTYWLHRAVGNSGTVYAFEADPYYALATDLTIKLIRLKGVYLSKFGLSEQDEEVPFRVTDASGSRLSGQSHVDRNADRTHGSVRFVKLKRLDSLINDYPKLAVVKLIKCDVEGYELYVFRRAAEIIDHARPFIILEVGHFEKQGYSAKDVFEYFTAKDYASFAMIADNTLAKTNSMLEHENALSVNRLIVPKEQLARLHDMIKIIDE